jgi:hypothetical protein
MFKPVAHAQKIMLRHKTADTVRMAVAHSFAYRNTLAELFTTIKQRPCDGCGGHAPFLEVRNLKRRRLITGGRCVIQ